LQRFLPLADQFGLAKRRSIPHSLPHRAPKALGADLDDGK
jgi:hypothetical protein